MRQPPRARRFFVRRIQACGLRWGRKKCPVGKTKPDWTWSSLGKITCEKDPINC